MASSLDDRLKAMGVQDGPGHGHGRGQAPYPMSRQSTIAHPLEQTYGYSTWFRDHRLECRRGLGYYGWLSNRICSRLFGRPTRTHTHTTYTFPRPGYGFAYAARAMRKTVPKHELPEGPLPANVVKTLIDDEVGHGIVIDRLDRHRVDDGGVSEPP